MTEPEYTKEELWKAAVKVCVFMPAEELEERLAVYASKDALALVIAEEVLRARAGAEEGETP